MYCPNCKQEFEGKFCPECGTRMIEKPDGGFSINLGDANAISGGINLSDSHNDYSQHYDQRGQININGGNYQVNNIAAQKSDMQILQEKKSRYLAECRRAYEDNVLDQAEVIALEEIRIKLDLDKASADSILESVRIMSERNARKTTLSRVAQIRLMALSDNLMKNDVDAILGQIDSLKALADKFEHEELSRKFFLALAALQPEKCIEQKENCQMDSYWMSYWSYIAYIKTGRYADAERVINTLDRFADYPEDNISVLAVAGALMIGNTTEAKELFGAVSGDYIPALQRLVDSILLLLDSTKAEEMSIDEKKCSFYMINLFNQKIVIYDWDNVDVRGGQAFYNGFAKVCKNGLWGFINKNGKNIVPCKYDEARFFSEDGMAGVNWNGLWGFVDKEGTEVVPCKYNDISAFHEGLCAVKEKDLWGYIDKYGRSIIPCSYKEVGGRFCEGLASVLVDDIWGFVDNNGNMIISPKYDDDGIGGPEFEDGLAIVCYYEKYGAIDKNGKETVKFKYDYISSFCNGMACVREKDLCGYVDKTGKEAIPCKIKTNIYRVEEDYAYDFKEGCARIVSNGRYGFINKKGENIVSYMFDEAEDFENGLALVAQNGLYGFIDQRGNQVIPCIYEEAYRFEEEVACVKLNGLYGFIDRVGNQVIPCKFKNADSFQEGLACVTIHGLVGFIDKTGEIVVPCKYERAYRFEEGRAFVEKDGKWGLLSNPISANRFI